MSHHPAQLVEQLRAAREVLTEPERWAPGDIDALDLLGRPCSANDKGAVRWSLFGALRKAKVSAEAAVILLDVLPDGMSIGRFNRCGLDLVLGALHRAVAAAERRLVAPAPPRAADAIRRAALLAQLEVPGGEGSAEVLLELLEQLGHVAAQGQSLRRRVAWLAETEEGEGYVAVGRLEFALFKSGEVDDVVRRAPSST